MGEVYTPKTSLPIDECLLPRGLFILVRLSFKGSFYFFLKGLFHLKF